MANYFSQYQGGGPAALPPGYMQAATAPGRRRKALKALAIVFQKDWRSIVRIKKAGDTDGERGVCSPTKDAGFSIVGR